MNLEQAIAHARSVFKNKSVLTFRESWQGLDVSDKPDMVTHELIGHSVIAELLGRKTLDYYQEAIKPDLPWADDHYNERICGEPLNPPPSEAYWPHAPEGNNKFKVGGIFSHTYPERFWPKRAGAQAPGIHGIRYPVGDFDDFVNLLAHQPYTRQAYFPIFFPEDTGNIANVRTPCTLGYHLLASNERMDITYYMRSCDILRHFHNDIYFAVRFLLTVLERLPRKRPWIDFKPGMFRMHIASLHCFRNDWYKLYGVNK